MYQYILSNQFSLSLSLSLSLSQTHNHLQIYFTVKALLKYGLNATFEYTRSDGTKFTRPLLKGPPSVCFKSLQEVIAVQWFFTCVFAPNCPCSMDTQQIREEKRLKGLKQGTCPFQRGLKILDIIKFIPNSLEKMIMDLHESRDVTGKTLEETFPRTYLHTQLTNLPFSTFELMVKSKWHFPYEAVNTRDWDYLRNITTFKPEDFQSTLRQSNGLTNDEFQEFQLLTGSLGVTSLAELIRQYNISDCLLGSDTVAYFFNHLHRVCGIFPTFVNTVASLAIRSFLLASHDPEHPQEQLFMPFLNEECYESFSKALQVVI